MLVSLMNSRSPSTDTVGGAAAVRDPDRFPPDDLCSCDPRASTAIVVATAVDASESLGCGGPVSETGRDARGGSLRVDGSTDAADGA